MDYADIAAQVLAHNDYMTISTASVEAEPWGTPVHFAHDERYVYWMSEPDATHSQNLADNPHVFITMFDSGQTVGDLA